MTETEQMLEDALQKSSIAYAHTIENLSKRLDALTAEQEQIMTMYRETLQQNEQIMTALQRLTELVSK